MLEVPGVAGELHVELAGRRNKAEDGAGTTPKKLKFPSAPTPSFPIFAQEEGSLIIRKWIIIIIEEAKSYIIIILILQDLKLGKS